MLLSTSDGVAHPLACSAWALYYECGSMHGESIFFFECGSTRRCNPQVLELSDEVEALRQQRLALEQR